MINYRELLKRLDPELEFLEKWVGSFQVFLVSREKELAVLKLAPVRAQGLSDRLSRESLTEEIRALEIVDGVEGLPRLFRKYDSFRGYHGGLLRTYFPGNVVGDEDGVFRVPRYQEQIDRQVGKLHSLGIAGLDLHGWNFVLSDDDSKINLIEIGEIVDFDYRGMLPRKNIPFEKRVDMDKRCLKALYGDEKDWEFKVALERRNIK